MQKLRMVGKKSGAILSRLLTKVHDILRQHRRRLVASNALTRFFISCFILEIQAVKFAVKVAQSSKKVVLGPQFLGEGYSIFGI